MTRMALMMMRATTVTVRGVFTAAIWVIRLRPSRKEVLEEPHLAVKTAAGSIFEARALEFFRGIRQNLCWRSLVGGWEGWLGLLKNQSHAV